MIGIDANILLRYLTRDNPPLVKRADFVLEECCSAEKPGFVTTLALAELFWTLRSSYGYERGKLIDVIDGLLNAQELRFEHVDSVCYALEQYRDGFGFVDAMIGHISTVNGCDTTMTLDKKAAKMANFSVA